VNAFIVFVKFLGWIVAIWVRLARLIEENGYLRFWKGPNYKNKIYNNYKKNLDPGGPGSVPALNKYKIIS